MASVEFQAKFLRFLDGIAIFCQNLLSLRCAISDSISLCIELNSARAGLCGQSDVGNFRVEKNGRPDASLAQARANVGNSFFMQSEIPAVIGS